MQERTLAVKRKFTLAVISAAGISVLTSKTMKGKERKKERKSEKNRAKRERKKEKKNGAENNKKLFVIETRHCLFHFRKDSNLCDVSEI